MTRDELDAYARREHKAARDEARAFAIAIVAGLAFWGAMGWAGWALWGAIS